MPTIRVGDTPTKPTQPRFGQPNGPRKKAVTGRNRNTVVNNASKKTTLGVGGAFGGAAGGTLGIPAVSPGSALAFGNQTASAQYDFLARLAQLRQEKAMLRGGFLQDKAGARETRIGEATAAEGNALSRGIVGSSSDLATRAGAVTNEAEAIAAARSERNLGLLGVSQGRLDANSTYYRTLADISAQRAAEQSMMAIDEFGSNITGNQQDYGAILKSLLAAIQDQKSGKTVRTRKGLGDPNYERLLQMGSTPEGAARLAHLLREGL